MSFGIGELNHGGRQRQHLDVGARIARRGQHLLGYIARGFCVVAAGWNGLSTLGRQLRGQALLCIARSDLRTLGQIVRGVVALGFRQFIRYQQHLEATARLAIAAARTG